MSTSFTHPITEDDIADYLIKTPDFFERYADLLASVRLFDPNGHRAISLQERQANLLRDKIKMFEMRIMDMIRNVNNNMISSDKLLLWVRALLLNPDVAALPGLLAGDLADRFDVPQVCIKVWDVAPCFADADFAQGVSDDAKLFASSLTEPFCGANTSLEVVRWLPDPSAVASLAILPLRHDAEDCALPAFGLLVLASPDAQRFNNTMGTEFLVSIAMLAGAALSRLRSDAV